MFAGDTQRLDLLHVRRRYVCYSMPTHRRKPLRLTDQSRGLAVCHGYGAANFQPDPPLDELCFSDSSFGHDHGAHAIIMGAIVTRRKTRYVSGTRGWRRSRRLWYFPRCFYSSSELSSLGWHSGSGTQCCSLSNKLAVM